ncbi:nucleotide-diphospho-sugar transferase-domain-containing protein [Jimgerdemannia flammicorona]|uniref:Nucleotide-diphospho-sugar transferase-domain-containing protein n=1 Tax=Jimgerdemannia flammicorona TaxID=994334 RepID=A0A433Q579_9FUNG|nr:nucleotide-diphospho-sugar transferase-domain-containing protein [Jimgerdemannia flammicorona]
MLYTTRLGRFHAVVTIFAALGILSWIVIPNQNALWRQRVSFESAGCQITDQDRQVMLSVHDNYEAVPLGTKFSPLSDDIAEAVNHNLAAERILITAVVNFGMLEYTLNWAESLRRSGYRRYLVFCIDDKLYDALSSRGLESHAVRIPQDWFHVEVSSMFETYRAANYRAITHAKSLVVERLLHANITVLFSDVDIVVLRPRMLDYLRARLHSRLGTEMFFTIENERNPANVVNSGFYIMKPTKTSLRVIAETIAIQDRMFDNITQQKAMNAALTAVTPAGSPFSSREVGLLDMYLFINGYMYFLEKKYTAQRMGIQPYIVHVNFMVGTAKKDTLKKAGLWYLDS